MCGIFGLIDIKKNNHQETKKFLHKLFELTEPRGRQATGLAVQMNLEINVYKRPQNATRVINSTDYQTFLSRHLLRESETVAALGHCRLVTNFSEINEVHNQPIQLDNVAGVHNGVINNFDHIRKLENLNPQGKSDSEILFRYFQKYLKENQNPSSIIKRFQKHMRGSASLGVLFSEFDEMLIFTNFGSLYYSFISKDLFVFTSEEKILRDFQKEFHLSGDIHQLEPGKAITVHTKTLESQFFSVEGEEVPANSAVPQLEKTNEPYLISNRTPHPGNIKRCSRCILPENYPFLSFDQNGVCSICQKYQKQSFKGIEALHRFLEPYRSKDGSVDCLVGLSGGRDSSYGLHLLKKELGMNPIGFAYDWLLTSRKARHNIAKMAGALDVEVVYRCGNYQRQAKNIRDNIYGFLKDPDLGMMTFVQAGDKEMYHYGREVRKEKNLNLTVWCSGYQLEQREFFIGYCGIDKTLVNNPRLYDYGMWTKIQLALYYGMKTIKNPLYWNRSIIDNALAFWHCFVAKDDFLYLFNYYPWDEKEVERVLNEEYEWEADTDYGTNQWRMDDFHTSFINYVYYTIGGFSEFDDFRSNQIREGLISRDEALRLTAIDNNIRYESLLEFSRLVGFNLEHVLKEIDAIPKLYRY